jgi:hypothetical protein
MEQVQIRTLLGVYQSWAKSLCAPLFWRDVNQQMHNATMTFVRTHSDVLGITNVHVAESFADCTDESGRICQLGGARLDPARFIARHPSMDLASFRLSDIILAQAEHLERLDPATVPTWPPAPPTEGDVVMFGGYPGIYREESADNIDSIFTWFAGKVASASDKNVAMVLEIATSKSLTSSRVPPHADLGGWSGGPVFTVVDSNGIERLELSAIIYEYSATSEIAFAHPLSQLTEDGNFIEL